MESMDEGNNSPKTDDDRQTFSIDQDSSDNLSSASSDTLLPAPEILPRETSQISHTRVHPVNTDHPVSLPNLTLKHPNRSDDDNDPFDDEKRIINDEHVKVSHINRATLQTLNNDILQMRTNRYSSRWNMNNVTVFRGNQRISQSTNGNLNNRQTSQITTRQRSTVHVSRISTAASINQGCNQKVIGSKPIVTRVSLVNELPVRRSGKKDLTHVSVRHASGNSKQSS